MRMSGRHREKHVCWTVCRDAAAQEEEERLEREREEVCSGPWGHKRRPGVCSYKQPNAGSKSKVSYADTSSQCMHAYRSAARLQEQQEEVRTPFSLLSHKIVCLYLFIYVFKELRRRKEATLRALEAEPDAGPGIVTVGRITGTLIAHANLALFG